MFIIFIFTQNIKIVRNISTGMTVMLAKAQISHMIVRNRWVRQLQANCTLYDDLITGIGCLGGENR